MVRNTATIQKVKDELEGTCINYLTYFDTVTELPNRNSLEKFLERLFSFDLQSSFAVIVIDINRFNIVNNAYGHGKGDLLLNQIAKRLKGCISPEDFIVRYSNNEFVVVLMDITLVEVSIEKILRSCDAPFSIDENEVFISVTAGVGLFPKHGNDIESLLKNAEAAMFYAKGQGKSKFLFYTSSMNKTIAQKINLESGLRKALDHDEFVLYYQPIIDFKNNALVSVESLIRWRHPKKGIIAPDKFISVAEETGLIDSIGEWALRHACQQFKQWKKQGFSPQRVAVNVSPKQLENKMFVDMVRTILDETELEPQILEIELTESVMQDVQHSTNIVQQLKAMGIRVAIDDFGTGYSSLSILKNLPIDILKIDKSFIDDITDDSRLVKSIIDIGHNLGFVVVAEGVENQAQASLLSENKCDFGQGYLFAKPLSSEVLVQQFLTI